MATPTPFEPGMVDGCTAFHLVTSGDTCADIASDTWILLSDFEAWNPVVGYYISRRAGDDPKTDHTRYGNWTEFDCTHPVVVDFLDYTPSERWRLMNADAAWDDIVRIWEETDSQRNDPGCSDLTTGSCSTLECEKGADSDTSGPAAQFIWNSLAEIHGMYKSYYDTMFNALAVVSTTLDDMENKFAPIPPEEDDIWLLILIDLITLGALETVGPYFNTSGSALDNAKDTAMTLIGQSTTIAKDALPGGDAAEWTPEKQDEFSAYLGQVIVGWGNITSLALEDLFSASPEAIDALWKAMSDGKLIEGKKEGTLAATGNAQNDLLANINKCIMGFALPALWHQSGSYTFIIDAGHACDEGKKLSDYLDDDTMDATGVCVDESQYYLAYPDGEATKCTCEHVTDAGPCRTICRDNKFSAPKGIEYISDGKNYDGVTKNDLIKGSVRTWIKNSRENGASVADPTNDGTLSDLMDVDVTTPGFMRIPVCSPDRAFQSWDTANKNSSPNWPCDIPPGKNECEVSSFVDQTSDASPNVEDCRQIIKNIEGDASTDWTTQVVGQNQREIAHHATCHFGVEATKTDGNVNSKVGGQDVIDIINDSIAQFARDGLIGAKGEINCNGNVKSQPILWGIY
ncbi:putative necrosis-inducing factor-domain-containing protein [Aspergillus cavernicola]|uniref:Necrosis-inducing factor-domain-containing protein n=1 Tax=Aspergillus cavernicola TaxID=176166 RepID=A0ABR4IVT4_9EURO